MRLLSGIAVAVLLLLPGIGAEAATIEELRSLWDARQYQRVLPLLREYRLQPGGRGAELEFLIGTSLCRGTDRPQDGTVVLRELLRTYQLPPRIRSVVEQNLAQCTNAGGTAPDTALSFVAVSGQVSTGPMVSGKAGYDVAASETGEASADEVPVAEAELRSRVFPLEQIELARAAAAARLTGGWADVDSGFVIASMDPTVYPGLGAEVGRCLHRYLDTHRMQFDLQLPPGVPTVYLAGNVDAVRQYLHRLHGVSLPPGTVAYSVFDDRSVVGIAGFESCGSLAHELVHLGMRRDFSGSPAWLEEGLASEVAVAYPAQPRFQFRSSWRDAKLRQYWALRPSVEQLLDADWSRYIAHDAQDGPQVAALQAMAAVFVRYLDARQQLVPVYRAVRDQRWPPGAALPVSVSQIVETRVGKDLAAIDADFVQWFGYAPK